MSKSGESMKAAFVERPSEDSEVEVREVPKPVAGPGEVLIECHYGSLNWADTMIIRGVYPGQLADPPYVARENVIPGAEVSGKIAALGEGVEGLEVGQVVTAVSPRITDAFAEYLVTDPRLVTVLPIATPTAEAACFRGVGFTAYHLLFSAYRLKAGDIVLVHSISGGVGLAVTQLAAEVGAIVIGTTSSAEKAALALECGAKHVFVRDEGDLVRKIREVTDGHGIDLMIDSLGGETLLNSIDAMALHGHIVNIGNTGDGGWPGSLKDFHDRLYPHCASYQAFDVWHSAPPDSPQWKAGVDYLVERFVDERFQVPVAETFTLRRCQDMMQAMRTGRVRGKLCLAIRDGL